MVKVRQNAGALLPHLVFSDCVGLPLVDNNFQEIWCHQMSDLKAKMYQNSISTGVPPQVPESVARQWLVANGKSKVKKN